MNSTNLPEDTKDINHKKKDNNNRSIGPIIPRYDNNKIVSISSDTYKNNKSSTIHTLNQSIRHKSKDDNDTNIYHNALKTFLGKDQTVSTNNKQYNIQNALTSHAVRPKKSVLDNNNNEVDNKYKKTLLSNDDRKEKSIHSNIKNMSMNNKRPSSAPLKDKDKLNITSNNNNNKKTVNKYIDNDSYTSKYHISFDSHKNNNIGGLSNAIYKGPVIKKKVLN